MCDPQWINLPPGSTLRVSEADNTGVGIRASVSIDGGPANGHPLPIVQPLGPGMQCIVFLDMAGAVSGGSVTLESVVEDATGAVIRGPDACSITLRSDEVGSSQVMAVAVSGP